MSQRLSTSATFRSLESRVAELEGVTPLPATLANNTYLSAKRHDGVVTRIAGVTASDILYIGGIDAPVSSVVIAAGGSSSSAELSSAGTKIWGTLTVTDRAQAPIMVAPSSNGLGGSVEILGSGVAGYTGIVQFHKLDGTRNGFVGFNAENGPMHYGSDTGAGHYFEGGTISPSPDMRFGLRFNSVDGILDFDANDYLYYSRASDKFVFDIGGSSACNIAATGLTANGLSAPTIGIDANFYSSLISSIPTLTFDVGDTLSFNRTTQTYSFALSNSAQLSVNALGTFVANVLTVGDSNFGMSLNGGGQPLILYDNGDYASFIRSSNIYSWVIGNTTKATLDSSGNFVAYGAVLASADSNFGLSVPFANTPRVTFDTGGDYISYDRVANKYYFVIGGVNVASIDASGNMRLKGTLTQSVTP